MTDSIPILFILRFIKIFVSESFDIDYIKNSIL
jgi:hypothetical protein